MKTIIGVLLGLLLGLQIPVHAAGIDLNMDVEMPYEYAVEEQMDFNITVTNHGGNVIYQVLAYLDGMRVNTTAKMLGRAGWTYGVTFSYTLPVGSYILKVELWAEVYPSEDLSMVTISHIEFTVPAEPEVQAVMAESDPGGGCFVEILN